MAWERYGNGSYYYRSERHGNKVHKVYYGRDRCGQIAAAIDTLFHAEGKAVAEKIKSERKILADAVSVVQHLNRWCDLIAAAALFAAGFHRPRRHAWKGWRDGKRFL